VFEAWNLTTDEPLQRHRIVLRLVKRLGLERRSLLSDPDSISDPNAVAFDLDDNDTHVWVNEDDVGLMVLVAPAHTHIRNDKPITEKRSSEAVHNNALGIVLQ
jgi:hypothetical protein